MKQIFMKAISDKNNQNIIVSHLQMCTPYYPRSQLAKSKFHGFYTLFVLYTAYFAIIYPTVNYIESGFFFQKQILTILRTNLYSDGISILVFLALSLFLMTIAQKTKFLIKNRKKGQINRIFLVLISILWLLFIGIGFYIVRTFSMYFSDKIFIVVFSWVYFVKTISFIFDVNGIVSINEKLQVEQNQIKQLELKDKTISKSKQKCLSYKSKITYLISPEIIFKRYLQNHDQNLVIHPTYLFNKALTCFFCLLANLIVMVQFLQPLCSHQTVQKKYFIQVFFSIIPSVFYANVCLYFMIIQNIFPAVAELTKMKDRTYYQDWWNSQTIYQFLDKWVLLINSFTKQYLKIFWVNTKIRALIHVGVIMFLIFQIFSITDRQISFLLQLCIFVFFGLLVFLFGGIKQIQNNHIVHILVFSFTPLMFAIQIKYSVFTGKE